MNVKDIASQSSVIFETIKLHFNCL